MTRRGMMTGARLAAVAALAATGALALSACEEHAYPSPSQAATAAPVEGQAELMGAPDGAGPPPPPPGAQDYAYAGPAQPGYGPPSTRTPQYVPGEGQAYGPGAPPPPPEGPPPYPQPGYEPAPYAQGYPPRPMRQGPPPVISMQPIPNPPEEPRHVYEWRRRYGHRHDHRGWWGPVYAAPGAHDHNHAHRTWTRAAVAPHHRAASVARPAAKPAPAKASHATAATPQLIKPKAPAASSAHPTDAATVSAASGAPGAASNQTASDANQAGNTTDGSEAQRYDGLQGALSDAIAHSAVLAVPAQMTANQAADVTLTIPGDFAQTLRTAAAQQNLSDEASAVNLTSTLSGDGYAIVPAEAQSLPLVLGQPTVFHWKVTPQSDTHGQLKADVRADLLGAGHNLALGAVKSGGGAMTGRVIGIGLLGLIALVLIGWAAQRRRPRKATGATRPNPYHTNGDSNPPPRV